MSDEVEKIATEEAEISPEVEVAESDADRSLIVEGDVAADYLEGLLDVVDLDGDIVIDVANGRASVDVVEANEGELSALVGDDGTVLNAIQELTRLAVSRESGGRSRLMLDIAGFREGQRQQLRSLAQDAVNEVQSNGESVRLAAMNSFERKVVHDVAAEAGLPTESEGAEPNRYVVISPA